MTKLRGFLGIKLKALFTRFKANNCFAHRIIHIVFDKKALLLVVGIFETRKVSKTFLSIFRLLF
jgi:hypothetical protein